MSGNGGEGDTVVGKSLEGVREMVLEKVDEYLMYLVGKWWKRQKELLYGEWAH